MDLVNTKTSDLFIQYSNIIDELIRRKVIRSTNNPVADYAEFLVSKSLKLDLVEKSTTGYDALDVDGVKYEIKSRRINSNNKSRQLSAIRGLDKNKFDFLAGILFSKNFTVLKACLIPINVVKELSVYREHVNAWIFYLRDSVWEQKSVKDITAELKKNQRIFSG